jgi:hypothetical protein
MRTVGTFDVPWDYTTPVIWQIVEPAIGLLCACVPVMGTLVPKAWMQSIISGKKGDQNDPNALQTQTIPGSTSRTTLTSGSEQALTTALYDENTQWRVRQLTTAANGTRKLWAFT